MIKLYHCIDARSFRPLWMLEEMGLPYDLAMLPFPPRILDKAYLGINPLGTIPLMLDGETRMTESSAICEYLATRHGPTPLAVSSSDDAYGFYLNWLHFGEATLTFPQTIVLRYSQLEPEERRSVQVVADYARWFLARLRSVETALAEQDYLCAGRFTAADISVGYACMLAENLGFSNRFSPAVRAYLDRLKRRDPFKRAKRAQSDAASTQLEHLGTQVAALDIEAILAL